MYAVDDLQKSSQIEGRAHRATEKQLISLKKLSVNMGMKSMLHLLQHWTTFVIIPH
jgi:hypothetical protein